MPEPEPEADSAEPDSAPGAVDVPAPGFGHRALQWLLAKAPEPVAADPRPAPLPDIEPAVDPVEAPVGEPVQQLVRPDRPRPRPSGYTAHDPEADSQMARFLEATDPAAGESTGPDNSAKDERPRPRLLTRSEGGLGAGGKKVRRLVILVVILAATALLLRTYVVSPYYIPSESMEPTLHGCKGCNDDHVIVDKFSYRLHEPRPSDIVVFNRPAGVTADESVLIKRVIAVPGDTVVLRGGRVFVDGARLRESYLNSAFIAKECHAAFQPTGTYNPFNSRKAWKIPDGELFVMGDNRCNSTDSRAFGPIKESSVIGRAFAIFWPLKRLRTL